MFCFSGPDLESSPSKPESPEPLESVHQPRRLRRSSDAKLFPASLSRVREEAEAATPERRKRPVERGVNSRWNDREDQVEGLPEQVCVMPRRRICDDGVRALRRTIARRPEHRSDVRGHQRRRGRERIGRRILVPVCVTQRKTELSNEIILVL